jgi:alkyldihydroxyacetonephosphate synthase
MRWWGWGEDGHASALPPAADELLRAQLGVDGSVATPPVGLGEVRIPEPSLPGSAREGIAAAVGEANVLEDREQRVVHALGKSYPDLFRIRSGDGSSAPDAVVRPGSADEVAAVLAACSAEGVAVVPFGGGSSVVGGVEPLRDGHAGAISLDLGRMNALREVDRTSLTASFDAGLFGPHAEAELGRHGLTLGHFPQSFEYSTVGGWVATRSAGQASTGFGRIDELVEAVRCVAPAGEVSTRNVPGTAAGPSLKELIVGSEGVLGVITEATLRVRPAPEERHYEGWSFRSFDEGVEAFRALEQAGASPDIARLSDEHETRLSLAMAGEGTAQRLGLAYLRLRGHEGGCVVIVGFEGDRDDVAARRVRTGAMLRAGGGVALGARPGRAWARGRYHGPYLRDELMSRGVMVETLETAAPWSGLMGLYAAVGGALRTSLAERGTPPIVLCHVSHLYPTGASLYFTFIAAQERGAELDQWRAAKTAACDAIIAAGGTITHHHAVGRDHVPWMPAEIGDLGIELLRAAKERLDPAGIMNPGKLTPAGVPKL